MKAIGSITFAVAVGLAALLIHFSAADSVAESGYFKRCSGCHTAPAVRTCNGCHKHGARGLKAKTDKTVYAAGETVTVTVSGGAKSGWFRAMLFDQNGAEVGRSNGNLSGMGGATTFPATLTAPAPAASGTYTWKAAWYGHKTGSSGGSNWILDAGNLNHGRQMIAITAFTVTGPPDTSAPTVTSFTLPATSPSLTIPVETLAATDNIGITGYLVTTSSVAPAAGDSGWSATKPTTVKAPGNGSITFHVWAKDAAGNVSTSSSATVEVTYVSSDPVLTVSTLPDNAFTNERTLNVAGTVVDPDGVVKVTVNRKLVTVGQDNSFSRAIVLGRGVNTITVTATDTAGNTSTDVRRITYDPKAPVLVISGPADNLKTNESLLTINGRTNEASTVAVKVNSRDSQAAEISGNNFTATVTLDEGVNTIEITATDVAGNTSVKKRTVIYDQTNPALEITGPAEDTTITTRSTVIIGTVSDDLRVKVKITANNRTASIGTKKGTFHRRVTFSTPGEYPVTITATDEAGNESSVTRRIFYELPVAVGQ